MGANGEDRLGVYIYIYMERSTWLAVISIALFLIITIILFEAFGRRFVPPHDLHVAKVVTMTS